MNLLFLFSAVGPLGSGMGGGIELKIRNLAREMQRRGHRVAVIAPTGSVLPGETPLIEVAGAYQTNAFALGRQSPITMPSDPAQANILDRARQLQADYDLIVNFAYEWLPLYLTPFFTTPLAHFMSLPSLMDFMDEIINRTARAYPGLVGVNTRTQAQTFAAAEQLRIVGSGIDLGQYAFQPEAGPSLAWVGRITPEKGLADALAVAARTGLCLKIFGAVQDEAYWAEVRQAQPDAPFEYMGFVSTAELQRGLGQCRALLMTHQWVEAFGNVAIEALACGVPVLTYRRGGPAEIVRHGETGFIVEPDDVAAMVEAVGRVERLSRRACRAQAEAEFSLQIQGDRYERWFQEVAAVYGR